MWWRKRKTEASDAVPPGPNLPLIRLERISKVFEGDADEETRALDELTLDIHT